MPTESVEVVERMVEAFRRGDFDGAMACIAPDVVWDPATPDAALVDSQSQPLGQEGVRDFFRRWLGTWQDYSYEQRELIDAGGGKVVSVFVERGTGKGSGLTVETELAGVYEVMDGLVVAWTRYPTARQAHEAAGLSE